METPCEKLCTQVGVKKHAAAGIWCLRSDRVNLVLCYGRQKRHEASCSETRTWLSTAKAGLRASCSFALVLHFSHVLHGDTEVSHGRMHTPWLCARRLVWRESLLLELGEEACSLAGGRRDLITYSCFLKTQPEARSGLALLACPSRSCGDTQGPWQRASASSRYNCRGY